MNAFNKGSGKILHVQNFKSLPCKNHSKCRRYFDLFGTNEARRTFWFRKSGCSHYEGLKSEPSYPRPEVGVSSEVLPVDGNRSSVLVSSPSRVSRDSLNAGMSTGWFASYPFFSLRRDKLERGVKLEPQEKCLWVAVYVSVA